MQVRVIRARADQAVGDVAEMPDGAEFSDLYYEPVTKAAAPPAAPAVSAPAAQATPAVVITADGPRPADTTKAGA
jgi:hypothetical protein